MNRPSRRRLRHPTPEAKTMSQPATPCPPARDFSHAAEGQRLWNQLTKGMEGIYRVAKDYEELGLPGDPLPQLYGIHKDLTALIRKLETRTKQ
jgi:hypothetical protein